MLALALDLFQYAYGAIVWGVTAAKMSRRATNDTEVNISTPLKIPTFVMFYGKFVSAVLGYLFLVIFVADQFA